MEAWSQSVAPLVNSVVTSSLRESDMKGPVKGERYRELSRNIKQLTRETEIKEVKIWGTNGMVLFSEHPEQIGKKYPRTELFNRAARGRTAFEISRLSEEHQKREVAKHASLLEIYTPIRFPTSDKIQGVFEIYVSTSTIDKQIRDTLISVISAFGALGILLIALAQISSRTLIRNYRLSEHADELKRSEEQFRRISGILQESLIKPLPEIPGLSAWVGYESALEAEKVGGDFYDIFQLGPGRAAILVGDVAGKGVEAAGLTETIRSSVRSFAYINRSPSFILSHVNEVLSPQISPDEFATAILVIVEIDDKRVRVVSAGHPPPLILGTTDYFLNVEPGLPLGIQASDYHETSLKLEDNGAFLLYTDGLIEARRGAKLFGQEGVFRTVSGRKTSEPQAIVENLLQAATAFAQGSLGDDVALVAIRFR